jgi:hypothetical protein
MSNRAFVVALLLLAAISAMLMLYATREGVGLSPDADTYLALARRLAAGERSVSTAPTSAQSQPATHYPPGYPFILAAISKLGVDMLSGARVLNAFAFGGAVVLSGLLLRIGLGLDRAAALIGAAVVALARHLLYINSMVLSDGAFVFLLLAGWLLLGRFLDRPQVKVLVIGACVIAVALLTRYAGIALAAAGGLALLLNRQRGFTTRIKDAMVFNAIALAPLVLWVVMNVRRTGSAVDRALSLHWPPATQWQRAAETIAQWLWPTPQDWLTAAGMVTVAVLCIVAVLSWRNARREGRAPLGGAARVMLWFIACYIPVVLITVTLVDANTWMDFRILAPLQLAVTLLVISELARSRLPPSAGAIASHWPVVMLIAAVAFILGQAARCVAWAHEAPELYVGYSMVKWRSSQTLAYVNDLPADTIIYTNATALLRLRADRVVKQVPAVVDPSTLKPLPELDRRLRAMERDLRNRDGYVVYFDDVRRPNLISCQQLERELKLRLVYRGSDGQVLQLRQRQRD